MDFVPNASVQLSGKRGGGWWWWNSLNTKKHSAIRC